LNVTALVKVLLVDDGSGFVADLTRRLAGHNCSVTAVRGAGDVFGRLSEDRDIEVVLLNFDESAFDGVKILQGIKKNWPLVEVIVVTGHAAIDAAVNAVKFGASEYLPKPLDIEKLVHLLEKAASRKRRRDKLILDIYMTPYMTRREREKRIAGILSDTPEH
jgi:DNA-binding NtrC family response regulator